METEIKQLISKVIEHVDQKFIETQRHFEVLTEHLDHRFDLLAEQVVANTEKLFEHDKKFDKIDGRLETLEVIMFRLSNHLELRNRVST